MSEEKMLRFKVLQMAMSMCDQEYLLAPEVIKRVGPTKYPTVTDVIAKAETLMSFVDAPQANSGEKVQVELLNETDSRR